MARVTERALRSRLARVEALHRGATTPGERQAAALAAKRLLERIRKVRRNDPIAQFCAAHVASLGVAPNRPPPGERVPSQREMLRVLTLWEADTWDAHEVYDWASHLVDRVVLPVRPDHEAACRADVLLQLAGYQRLALRRADVPEIRAFVTSRDWAAWFAFLAEAAQR